MPRKCMIENGGAGDAVGLAMAASRLNKKTGKQFKRKTSRASSEAGFSMHSGMSGFRLKSAFVVGRRGSPSTPMPSWKVHGATPIAIKMEKQHLHANGITHDAGHNHYLHHHHDRLPRPHVSARKLAASLWELQDLPFSRGGAAQTPQLCMRPYPTHVVPDMSKQSNSYNQQIVRPCSPAFSMGSCLGDSTQVKQLRTSLGRREGGVGDSKIRIASITPRSSVLAMEAISSKLVSGCEVTTNELVKVLNYMWSLEERHVHTMSVVGALQAEVDQARSQLKDLLLKESAHSKDVEHVTKRIAEERAMWEEQQGISIREALLSIRQELDSERKSKQKLEALNKKVTKELRDARKKLGIVLEDFEKERRARELMEDVCDELAREVGEDKARVEELKRESLKVREEIEEERKMLQMAEVWREERVQMKLMEAKLELEEKNSALDKLRGELEVFIEAKRGSDTKEEPTFSQHTYRHSRDASSGRSFADLSNGNEQRVQVLGRKSLDSVGNVSSKNNALRGGLEGEGSEGEDDLHSIELNSKVFSVMPGSNQCWQHSSQAYGSVCNGRKSVDERPLATHKPLQSASARVQGLERPRNNKDDISGVGVERDGHYDHLQVSQWIECSFEGGEMKEWGQEQQEAVQAGREKCIGSWENGNGCAHDQVSCSSKVSRGTVGGREIGRAKSGPLSDRKESIFSRDRSDFLCRKFNFQNVQSNSLLSEGHEGLYLASSPTRQWSQLWSSPYFGNESFRGGTVDVSMGRMLETKLEGQQRAWKKLERKQSSG